MNYVCSRKEVVVRGGLSFWIIGPDSSCFNNYSYRLICFEYKVYGSMVTHSHLSIWDFYGKHSVKDITHINHEQLYDTGDLVYCELAKPYTVL